MSGTQTKLALNITAVDGASKQIDAIRRRIEMMNAPAERITKSFSKLSDSTGITSLANSMRRLGQESYGAFESISKVGTSLGLVGGAASIAGLAKLTSNWASFGTQLGFSANRAGMTVTQLSALQGAARLAGVSADALTAGMTGLKDNLVEIAAGRAAPETVAAFSQLGISIRDANGHIRSANEVLPEIATKVAAIKDPTMRAKYEMLLLGSAGEQLDPLLRRGATGITALSKEAERLGSLTDKSAEAANRFRESQVGLTLSAEGLGNAISEQLAPAMIPLMDGTKEWIVQNKGVIATNLGGWAKDYGDALKYVGGGIDAVVASTVGWNKALEVGIPLLASMAIGPLRRLELGLARLALIQIPSWLGSLVGISGSAIGALGTTLALSGDSGPNSGGVSPDQESANRRSAVAGGALTPGQWMRYHLPQALGGSGIKERAMPLMDDLKRDLGLTTNNAAGIASGLAAESGIQAINEKNPLIPGSRGGFGFGQWTGPRRIAFEKYAADHGLDPTSYAANYGFLKEDLTKNYPGVLADIRNQRGATASANAFFPYESGGDPRLAFHLADHSQYAESLAATGTPANIGGGNMSAWAEATQPTTTVKGSANVNIRVSQDGSPPRTTASTDGDLFGKPRIETAMPFGGAAP